MSRIDERAAYVALALTPGIGPARMAALLEACETPAGALAAPAAFLRSIPGISPAAATAITTSSVSIGARVLGAIAGLGAHCLLPEEFPPVLRLIPDPPTLLFAQGDRGLLDRLACAIVGSRDHSSYGAAICREVSAAAGRAGVVVVSGMARGLDALAHAAALDSGGATIGVLGNGLGVVYPAANRQLYRRVAEAGLLLTEFPPGERPGVGAFPRRNRLISALARVVVVIEAAAGSGTLITVGTALAQGKDVMAVPGDITSATSWGTNRLIRDGAEPLLEVADLLAHYPELGAVSVDRASGEEARRREGEGRAGETVPRSRLAIPNPPEDLSPAERRVFEDLRPGPRGLDDLIGSVGLPAGATLAAISGLELRGLLWQEAGALGLGGR